MSEYRPPDHATLRERREAHEASLGDPQWFTPQQLAKRWQVSHTTVRAIPIAELRYKEFGQGEKLKRRRYKLAWIEAYEDAKSEEELRLEAARRAGVEAARRSLERRAAKK
jgi:hypothetical protein